MGYKNDYIIDPEIEDDEQPIIEKSMESVSIPNNTISRDYEIVEPEELESKSVLDEIHEEAVKEGLVKEDEDYIGGENASPEEVISALKNKKMSEGAQKNKEEYEESKMKKNRKIMATRDLLTGLTRKNIRVVVPIVCDVEQPDGSIAPELCDTEIVVRRLTESQFNHLVNRRIASKKLSEMTEEEYQQDNHFRSNFLAETVIEPKLSADEWYNDVSNNHSAAIFAKVQETLNNLDDVSLFQ